jgi:hypothetical protein
MKKLVFKISPSQVEILLRGKKKAGKAKLPRYFLQIDHIIRMSPHYQEWEAEKEKNITITFEYNINGEIYQVFLVIEGRPDYYRLDNGVLIEQKKQRIPQPGDPPEIWERFQEDVKKAAFQAGLYALAMNLKGENIQRIRIHFLWPKEGHTHEVVIDGHEMPLVDAIQHANYVCDICFREREIKSMYKRLWKLGLVLLLRTLGLGQSPAQPEGK